MPIPDERKEEILRRLNYVQGQINGVKKMVEEERKCIEILTQISASYEGLRKAGQLMIRNYIENCVTNDIRSDDPKVVNRIYDEMMKVIHKYSK
jgi:DNA-binding FrmR family transcriptional regulator